MSMNMLRFDSFDACHDGQTGDHRSANPNVVMEGFLEVAVPIRRFRVHSRPHQQLLSHIHRPTYTLVGGNGIGEGAHWMSRDRLLGPLDPVLSVLVPLRRERARCDISPLGVVQYMWSARIVINGGLTWCET